MRRKYLLGLYSTRIMRITRGLGLGSERLHCSGPWKRCCWLPQGEGDQNDRQFASPWGHDEEARVALEAWVRCPACLPRCLQPCFANSCNKTRGGRDLGEHVRTVIAMQSPSGLVGNGCPEAYGLPNAIFKQLSRLVLAI